MTAVDSRAVGAAAARVGATAVQAQLYRNGQLDEPICWGFVNKREGLRTSPRSMFCVGSAAKLLPIAVLLQATEMGLVDLDDTIPVDKRVANKPSLRELALHTAGVPEIEPSRDDDRSALADFALSALQRKREFLRGRPSLSNAGYAVLGYVLQTVFRAPYEEVVRIGVLQPLELADTAVSPLDALGRPVTTAARFDMPRALAPAGGTTLSTASDLALLAVTLFLRSSSRFPISADARALLRSSVDGLSGLTEDARLGFGCRVSGNNSIVRAYGGSNGHMADVRVNLESRSALAICADTPAAQTLCSELWPDFALAAPDPFELDDADPTGLAGLYSSSSGVVEVNLGDAGIVLTRPNLYSFAYAASTQRGTFVRPSRSRPGHWDVVRFIDGPGGRSQYVHAEGRAFKRRAL